MSFQAKQHLDYTLLKPLANQNEYNTFYNNAKQSNVKAVCIPPSQIKVAKLVLDKFETLICTVVGFPLGYNTTESKVFETTNAIQFGADEIDMVINLIDFKSMIYDKVSEDIQAVHNTCKKNNIPLKVIVESGNLSLEELGKICDICAKIDVDFVKTSTGFLNIGAELEKVKFMREKLPNHIQIKASGGIKNYEQANAFIEAGANRIGASSLISEPK